MDIGLRLSKTLCCSTVKQGGRIIHGDSCTESPPPVCPKKQESHMRYKVRPPRTTEIPHHIIVKEPLNLPQQAGSGAGFVD